jgi:site-specific recombinase XerD
MPYLPESRPKCHRTLQAYLGHSQIANTVRYTALDAGRFKGLWRR